MSDPAPQRPAPVWIAAALSAALAVAVLALVFYGLQLAARTAGG